MPDLTPDRHTRPAPGEPVHDFRPPSWARGCVNIVMIPMFTLASLANWRLMGRHAPWYLSAAVQLLVFLGTIGVMIGYARRCRIEVLPDAVLVNNGLHTRRVALAEISGVSATVWGLRITRARRRPLIAAAAPTPRHQLRDGRPTPAARIAATILAAASAHRP